MDIPLEYLTVETYHDPGGIATAAHLPGHVLISKESYRVIATRKSLGAVFTSRQSRRINGKKFFPYRSPRIDEKVVAELETNPDGTYKVDSKGRLRTRAWNFEHEYRKHQAKYAARIAMGGRDGAA